MESTTLESGTGTGAFAHELLLELVEIVGTYHVLTDPETMEPYRRDMQPLGEVGLPLAVVRPRTTEEVSAVVLACGRAGVPIIPRGAGSGMTGAANAVDGAITLVLTRMNDISVDEEAQVATVQAGAVTLEVKTAAQEHGLFYAPDPTSADWCTIGGNLANGSAGPCGAKYGVTGDAVRGLTVVLASGEVLRTGRNTLKGVTGYDLNRLFVGSEGTLGIITEAQLALSVSPPAPSTTLATFDDVHRAVDAVTRFLATGHTLSLLEIMDERCVSSVERYLEAPLNEDGPSPKAVLFGQSDTENSAALDAFGTACEEAGATLVYAAEDLAEGQMLMNYWSSLESALEQEGTWILHETTVPRTKVAELIERIGQASRNRGIYVGVHGHAADGTVHPMIVMDSDAEGQLDAAAAVYQDILDIALDLGGPVTGEHGVGRMKCDRFAQSVGETGMAVHRAIKFALDPAGLLNPGCMGLAQDTSTDRRTA
ncbi:glycolate oxidase [Kocuria dechangensis]|uniref:Glycolate oxidase n=1 Tax=Kocuria dechangensis TaxID=1176249 RepID=A0A917H312_9MICC|nr:FAD-binding oxidoreductase [Kocuria dechangensis]GGG65964.1 glycolate oxidase [Kocuria dechangensis]